jgi:hypothetical protein
VWGVTPAELQTSIDSVMAASIRQESAIPLVFQIPGWPGDGKIFVNAKPRERAGLLYTTETSVGYKSTLSLRYYCPDPRIYGLVLNSEQAAPSVASGGLVAPLVAPFVFSSSGTPGTIDATNDGRAEAFPTLRLDATGGTLTNPSIEHVESGKILTFTGVVPSGEYLLINTSTKTVLLNGTASRYVWLDDSEQWFSLAPGTNTLRFTGTSSGSPTLTATWYDAWI